ncbi:MAG: hypothetical protein LC776_00550 [Acidobacteria bacterium]|nr:hypothetical protein [Acidobacteriota bacterium]
MTRSYSEGGSPLVLIIKLVCAAQIELSRLNEILQLPEFDVPPNARRHIRRFRIVYECLDGH